MAEKTAPGRIIVITGLSGSGKSTALKALEDHGYLTIDNLPILLLPKLLVISRERGESIRLAVIMDAREQTLIDHHENVFQEARGLGYELSVIFLESDGESLVKRFSETRRPHHLAHSGDLMSAIQAEREFLAPLRRRADEVINTTDLKTTRLREIIVKRYASESDLRRMSVEVLSFGFKNGLPPETDLMIDVRFLRNPFYVDELRGLDGRDQPVIDFVMALPEAHEFLERFMSLLTFLLPHYQGEGKSYLTIAVGCTGGQHRSVVVASYLWSALTKITPGRVTLRHRDIPGRAESRSSPQSAASKERTS